MQMNPEELGRLFPVRRWKKQKQAFREAVQAYVSDLGYEYKEETGSWGCRNVVIGDPDKAEFLVTAHYDTCSGMVFPNLITPCDLLPFLLYQLFMIVWMILVPLLPGVIAGLISKDGSVGYLVWYLFFWVTFAFMFFGPANKTNVNDNTSGVITVLEIARTLPENMRHKVCFVMFDLEEMGLIGSSAFRKAHKKMTDQQLVLNLDCVGDGDILMMFPTKKLKKNKKCLNFLQRICGSFGEKQIAIRDKGFATYPSDQKNFPYGVGICALRNSPMGPYLGRIHTKRDTVMEQTNVNLLRAALTTLICSTEQKGVK